MTIDCPGAGPLAPSFTAGVSGNLAGRHSAFKLRANRPDGTQVIDGLSLRMPTGLLAKLKGVPRCGDAAASAGDVPGELARRDGDCWRRSGAASVLPVAVGCI